MIVKEVDDDIYNIMVSAPKSSSRFLDIHKSMILKYFDSDNTDLDDILWIPQGGAMEFAEIGIKTLVTEIWEFIQNISSPPGSSPIPWKIIFACGTGTTALYAARHFSSLSKNSTKEIEVIAVPCVSDTEDLYNQMIKLDDESGCKKIFPTILEVDASAPKRIFAEPYQEHLMIWKSLHETKISTFDLIYAPRTFEILQQDSYKSLNGKMINLFDDVEANIIYYHCGGDDGNASQLIRYRRKGLL